MSSRFIVTIDRVAYSSKPRKRDIGAITRRMQASGPVEVTPEELADAIANGHTWCGGCFEPSPSKWGDFIGQRITALDFDNDVVVLGADGKPLKDAEGHNVKRDLQPGEEGYLYHWDALARWREVFDADPLLMYPSFSYEQVADLSQPPTRCKYRIVFDLGAVVTSEQAAEAAIKKLLRLFPEADQSCKNANRLFFGSCGKAVAFREEGVYFAKRA